MDFTSRMLALLESVRRERNGEVADTMRYYGVRYGLNYGVSLPTLRGMVRHEPTDHAYARYLFQQDIREMKLAALWIAHPGAFTADEAPFWASGLVNSELAEEAAFALLSRMPAFASLYAVWTAEGQPLLIQYAALLGASRHADVSAEWLDAAADVVRRNPDDRLTAQGVIALVAALAQKTENRCAILRMIGSLGTSPSADFIHEETAWRLEA